MSDGETGARRNAAPGDWRDGMQPGAAAVVLCFAALVLGGIIWSGLGQLLLWSYLPTLPPLLLLGVMCVFRMPGEMEERLMLPAMLCAGLSPFVTWNCTAASDCVYFRVCLLLLNISGLWFLSSFSTCLEKIAEHIGEPALLAATRSNTQIVQYLLILPFFLEMAAFYSVTHNLHAGNFWRTSPALLGHTNTALAVGTLISTSVLALVCNHRQKRIH